MSVSKKTDGICLPLGAFRYPTYELNFKTSDIATDVNFAEGIIREANKLASQEYVQIFNNEFEKRKEFYNKQIKKNLEAIEFFEEKFSKETGTEHPQFLQEPPIFDDIVKTELRSTSTKLRFTNIMWKNLC